MRILGDEQAIANGRAQDVLGRLGFRIVVHVLKKDSADRPRLHHHVPSDPGLPRDHGLTHGDFGKDAQQIAPRCT